MQVVFDGLFIYSLYLLFPLECPVSCTRGCDPTHTMFTHFHFTHGFKAVSGQPLTFGPHTHRPLSGVCSGLINVSCGAFGVQTDGWMDRWRDAAGGEERGMHIKRPFALSSPPYFTQSVGEREGGREGGRSQGNPDASTGTKIKGRK